MKPSVCWHIFDGAPLVLFGFAGLYAFASSAVASEETMGGLESPLIASFFMILILLFLSLSMSLPLVFDAEATAEFEDADLGLELLIALLIETKLFALPLKVRTVFSFPFC